MKLIIRNCFDSAREFVYRNARPLDLARWHYHFERGGPKHLLSVLSAYQNGDGGYAHALEPDSWNPNSTPIQTWAATELLREIGFPTGTHPSIRGILRYLESGRDFSNGLWHNTVGSNADHPHAPWWAPGEDGKGRESFNPSAALAGFLLRFAPENTKGLALGRQVGKASYEAFMAWDFSDEMHTLRCFLRLYEYAKEAGNLLGFDLDAMKARLFAQMDACVTRDTALWQSGYVCLPSTFITGRDSEFYEGFKELADAGCRHIINSQLDDGSWSVNWAWADYPEAWAVSKNLWKGSMAVDKMLFLKRMGQLTISAPRNKGVYTNKKNLSEIDL